MPPSMALTGLAKDDALYLKILPTLLTMATSEYHTMPREWMMNHLNAALQAKETGKRSGQTHPCRPAESRDHERDQER